MSKPSITIGVPAYNEGQNIANLLQDLLAQEKFGFEISQIVVSSDGSSDNTVAECKKINSKTIKVIANPDRQGINRGLNQIINFSDSEILVLIDADVRIKDSQFISKLVLPIITKRADQTSARLTPTNPHNFFQSILHASVLAKNIVFESINDGNNLFTCHGPCRAMSRRFYTQLEFKDIVGNDMYSYLECIRLGFTYQYVRDTECFYTLPDNFSDHKKQSSRFIHALSEQSLYSDPDLIIRETTIHPAVYAQALLPLLELAFKKGFYLFLYAIVQTYISLTTKVGSELNDKWPIALSSKKTSTSL